MSDKEQSWGYVKKEKWENGIFLHTTASTLKFFNLQAKIPQFDLLTNQIRRMQKEIRDKTLPPLHLFFPLLKLETCQGSFCVYLCVLGWLRSFFLRFLAPQQSINISWKKAMHLMWVHCGLWIHKITFLTLFQTTKMCVYKVYKLCFLFCVASFSILPHRLGLKKWSLRLKTLGKTLGSNTGCTGWRRRTTMMTFVISKCIDCLVFLMWYFISGGV